MSIEQECVRSSIWPSIWPSICDGYVKANHHNQATISQDHIELKFKDKEWSEYAQEYYFLENILLCASSQSERLPVYLGGTYLKLGWEWRYEGVAQWQKVLSMDYRELFGILESLWDGKDPSPLATDSPDHSNQLAVPNRDVLVRAPLSLVAKELMDKLWRALVIVAKIRAAYDPPLEMDAVYDLISQGITDEQEDIGVPKVLGGIKMDGSTYEVQIL
ncbi:hypothetical protein M011DRAFT_480894 [Sporormia fimetaria CBS 119925]|uniref:Uncharacterized protein n=1 Tax=Sporormia fimetaria CBS 119925 TaxID=1340428 RepID=A0A6A6V015_9PLEO|nr:hypothetical protein M011DRAFT_480894 [Sporormia fimetaria CBS 119925]